jgi:hypothetical protein
MRAAHATHNFFSFVRALNSAAGKVPVKALPASNLTAAAGTAVVGAVAAAAAIGARTLPVALMPRFQ